jgi:hypothetical protein
LLVSKGRETRETSKPQVLLFFVLLPKGGIKVPNQSDAYDL